MALLIKREMLIQPRVEHAPDVVDLVQVSQERYEIRQFRVVSVKSRSRESVSSQVLHATVSD